MGTLIFLMEMRVARVWRFRGFFRGTLSYTLYTHICISKEINLRMYRRGRRWALAGAWGWVLAEG